MTQDCIYLIVKESGEYSDWTKENIAYYTTYEAAEIFIKLQEQLDSISECENGRKYRQKYSYLIEVIQAGKVIDSIDTHINEAIAERDRVRREKELAEEAMLNTIKATLDAATTDDMREVYKFLLWWEGGIKKDPYFQTRINARIHNISLPMKRYIDATGDEKVTHWFSKNKHRF